MMNAHTTEFTADAAASAVIPRATIEQIVKHRDKALELHEIAYDRMKAAADAELAARIEGQRAHCHEINSFNISERTKEKEPSAINGNRLPARDVYLADCRKSLDVEVWANIVKMSRLEILMDKTAKDQLRQALSTEPPAVTMDNIRATLEGWILGADEVFRRGIAVCFSNLDRRFKSHDGWKIGSRVILTYAFDGNGSWNYHRNHEDTLTDIERVFLTLDGKKVMEYGHLVDNIRNARFGRSGPRQTEFENDYFLLRAYKNGNCHIWFKRDNLLDKVNQLLGEYYGAPIPEDRKAEEHTGLNDPKTSLAKNYGFFPTPDAAAEKALERVSLLRDKDDPPMEILEPSAGTGNLARRCLPTKKQLRDFVSRPSEYRIDHRVDCIEVQTKLSAALQAEGIYRKVYNLDFLMVQPETTGLYDLVAMNPPFDRERDIDHVMHALKFLKPDGELVAIMSAGTEFRENKKSIAFRALVAKMNGHFSELPERSFSSVGTNCNTVVLRIRKDGRSARY